METCAVCAAPIEHSIIHGWSHAEPLAKLRVTAAEAKSIHDDPPPPSEPLSRRSYLHAARP
jgi:hypothetical protein